MPTKYEKCYGRWMCEMAETTEKENMVSTDKLIETFTDMANRGTLLCGKKYYAGRSSDSDYRNYCKSFNGFMIV